MLVIFAFFLMSTAFAFPPYRPVCTPAQFRNAAVNLTLEYQNYISECNYWGAKSLASKIAVGRLNEGNCPDSSCCQTVNTLINFNINLYGECEWAVYWTNQTPMTATILPCGDITVSAVSLEKLQENTEIARSFDVEFVWRPRCGATGCVTNCALELVDLKYARPNCNDWETPLCSDCIVKI